MLYQGADERELSANLVLTAFVRQLAVANTYNRLYFKTLTFGLFLIKWFWSHVCYFFVSVFWAGATPINGDLN